MQYISENNVDLKSGYSTFVLQNNGKQINFFAYTGDTAINANDKGLEINAHLGGYFLRKGFFHAISDADTNIVEPIYIDSKNNNINPRSVDEAMALIYKNELTISGFKFKENATDAEKERAFGKMINTFVSSSKNLDFSSDKYLFIVQGNSHEVIYNNGGSNSMQIDGVDVQEKLGLKTPEVAVRKRRQSMMQSKLR